MEQLRAAARGLPPAYFALVMATGINSVSMHDAGRLLISRTLLAIGVVALLVLLLLNAWRAVSFRDALLADLTDSRKMFGAFTLVAACDVLSSRLATGGFAGWALVLLCLGAFFWLVLGYVLPGVILVNRSEGPVLGAVDGTWFISVVGTQSVAIAAVAVEPHFLEAARPIALIAVMLWSLGVVLYLVMATTLLIRLLLVEISPDTITPPYWIVMGATAITVFAGARLLDLPPTPVLAASRPVLVGLSIVLWAFGTWVIPLLVAFGVWRHGIRKVPLRYEPALWSICFPLGMYSVASRELNRAVTLPLVGEIGRWWAWVALAAWVIVFIAMIVSLTRKSREHRTQPQVNRPSTAA